MVASATCKLQQGDDENALLTLSYYVAQNNFFDASISFRSDKISVLVYVGAALLVVLPSALPRFGSVSEEETEAMLMRK
jgi:hypothetical protein